MIADHKARQRAEIQQRVEARAARDRREILPQLPAIVTRGDVAQACKRTAGYKFSQGLAVTNRLAACGAIVPIEAGVYAKNARPQLRWRKA